MTTRIVDGSVERDRPGSPRSAGGLPQQGGGRLCADPSQAKLPVIVDLAPDDTDTVATVFAGLSPDSRYRRFRSARSFLPPGMLRQLAAVQPGRHVAHVALLTDRPVGLVRWIRWRDPRSAEIAYEVADAAQGRGIGRSLLRRAACSAQAAGVECFLAQLSGGQDALHRRVRNLGGQPDPTEPGLYRLPVSLVASAEY